MLRLYVVFMGTMDERFVVRQYKLKHSIVQSIFTDIGKKLCSVVVDFEKALK